MNWQKYKIVCSLLAALLLSACEARYCYDADDWGYPKITISAEAAELSLHGPPISQVADGIDSGQVLLDADTIPLVITIDKDDKWTSWFGGSINLNPDGSINNDGFDAGREVPLDRECQYVLNQSNNPADYTPKTLKVTEDSSCPVSAPWPTPDTYEDCMAPCWYKNGMGLYVGLAPNNNSKHSSSDVVVSYHIPDAKHPDGRSTYVDDPNISDAENMVLREQSDEEDGYLVRGLPSQELPGARTGDRLYFKIIDRIYLDNQGGYHVKIKEGTRDPRPGGLESIANAFIEPLKLVMVRVYNGIVTSQVFIDFVRLLLVLYMLFFGYTILISGFGEIKKDALTRIIKVGLVVTLIGDSSWNFFYNHLFAFFIDGTQQIAGLLVNPFGDVDPQNSWYAVDQVVNKLWSKETWAKILATFLSNGIGFIFIITMVWALVLFMLSAVKALVIYLVAFGTIALLIMMAPIFIIFILFERTKKMTEEWLNQLLVFSLQQIILLASLGMFSAIIVTLLQRLVGYKVCWETYWHFAEPVMRITGAEFRFYQPHVDLGSKSSIWMDANNDGIREANEMALRYADIPYLDPDQDVSQIRKMSGGADHHPSNFLSMIDVLTFIASVYLMRVFMTMVPTIATVLKSGGSAQSADMFTAGMSLMQSVGKSVKGLVGGSLDIGEKAYDWNQERRATNARTTARNNAVIAPKAGDKADKTSGDTTAANARLAQGGNVAGNAAAAGAQNRAMAGDTEAKVVKSAAVLQKEAIAAREGALNAIAGRINDLGDKNLSSSQKQANAMAVLRMIGDDPPSKQELFKILKNERGAKGFDELRKAYEKSLSSSDDVLTFAQAESLNTTLKMEKLMEGELRRQRENAAINKDHIREEYIAQQQEWNDAAPEREAAAKAKEGEDARLANVEMMRLEAVREAAEKQRTEEIIKDHAVWGNLTQAEKALKELQNNAADADAIAAAQAARDEAYSEAIKTLPKTEDVKDKAEEKHQKFIDGLLANIDLQQAREAKADRDAMREMNAPQIKFVHAEMDDTPVDVNDMTAAIREFARNEIREEMIAKDLKNGKIDAEMVREAFGYKAPVKEREHAQDSPAAAGDAPVADNVWQQPPQEDKAADREQQQALAAQRASEADIAARAKKAEELAKEDRIRKEESDRLAALAHEQAVYEQQLLVLEDNDSNKAEIARLKSKISDIQNKKK